MLVITYHGKVYWFYGLYKFIYICILYMFWFYIYGHILLNKSRWYMEVILMTIGYKNIFRGRYLVPHCRVPFWGMDHIIYGSTIRRHLSRCSSVSSGDSVLHVPKALCFEAPTTVNPTISYMLTTWWWNVICSTNWLETCWRLASSSKSIADDNAQCTCLGDFGGLLSHWGTQSSPLLLTFT
jgi:hypothetical protein